MLGVTTHEACYRKKQAALEEKYAEQTAKLNEKTFCSFCKAEVLASQERIIVGGAESHRKRNFVDQRRKKKAEIQIGDCYVKSTYKSEAEHVPIQDRAGGGADICSLCNKEVRASELGSCSFVGGRPR